MVIFNPISEFLKYFNYFDVHILNIQIIVNIININIIYYSNKFYLREVILKSYVPFKVDGKHKNISIYSQTIFNIISSSTCLLNTYHMKLL